MSPSQSLAGVSIHPTAIIDPQARLGEGVKVGPYCIIGPQVELGDHVEVMDHVSIQGPTHIGSKGKIYPHAVLGMDPQDKKYNYDQPSRLEIGEKSIIREFVTIHRGTPQGRGTTRVGKEAWLLAYTHIAHDCIVGDHVIMANSTSLGGFITVGDCAYLGAFTMAAPFCSIGESAFTGGLTRVTQDVPPFVSATGYKVRPYRINRVGMQRHGYSEEEIVAIEKAYRIFFRDNLQAKEALARLKEEFPQAKTVQSFIHFVENSQVGVCR